MMEGEEGLVYNGREAFCCVRRKKHNLSSV